VQLFRGLTTICERGPNAIHCKLLHFGMLSPTRKYDIIPQECTWKKHTSLFWCSDSGEEKKFYTIDALS